MRLRTTDGRLLFGAEHAREILAICASLRGTAEGDGHGSYGPAVLRTGCAQVLHHCLCSISTIQQTAEAHSPLRMYDPRASRVGRVLAGVGCRARGNGIHGVYGKPVWSILEGHFQILLANAQHIEAVPGRKTDTKDCQWIAELLQHGLLRGSFIPPVLIRDLRGVFEGEGRSPDGMRCTLPSYRRAQGTRDKGDRQ